MVAQIFLDKLLHLMRIKTDLENALYLSSLQSDLSPQSQSEELVIVS